MDTPHARSRIDVWRSSQHYQPFGGGTGAQTSGPEPSSTSRSCLPLLGALLTALRRRKPTRAPSQPTLARAASFVDVLPLQLLTHIVALGEYTAGELLRCSRTCVALASIVLNASNDSLLWGAACRRRWATLALDPTEAYPVCLRQMSHRQAYVWAEADGKRQLGTIEDLCGVESWRIQFRGPAGRMIVHANPNMHRQYTIGPFPYRLNGEYLSPTLGNRPRRFAVRQARGRARVSVRGIPDTKMVRRVDWGWELRNAMWVATSLAHRAPPAEVGIDGDVPADAGVQNFFQ